ncbi:histone deacetylase [Kordiimonas sp. SCSIO 12610]|uniref:histone deacetylase family protein n=1 Tax=Kordiimonas sp. SCSIO 12610 TaxID=2829597 RepID=UPI00210EFE6B|nr:histone deacetylase [Kordiimonas sp. SCSIO 12610]UTW55503.1 histone deacetylase [Kordiimonas sp. SCSIO 12610]
MLPIVHHAGYRVSLSKTGSHEESKYAALMDLIVASELVGKTKVFEPEPIPVKSLKLVHDTAYVDDVINLALDPSSLRRIGLAATDQLHIRPRLGTGGTYLAAKLALDYGLACNTAGGSHHAHAGFGSGFCVFNDVAVAIAQLRLDGLIKRALIIDLDVHQGDGTASIFAREPGVYTFSVHCEKNFPFRKSSSDLDIGLMRGVGDAVYMETLRSNLSVLLDGHKPDIVFYNAGVDPHIDDKLGHLNLSDDGLCAREKYVFDQVCGRSIPLVTVMGGGYGDDRYEVARRHYILFEQAATYYGQG